MASLGGWAGWGWLWGDVCFFQLPPRDTPRLGCSGMNSATSRANSTEHAPNRKGGPGIMELYRRENNGEREGERERWREAERENDGKTSREREVERTVEKERGRENSGERGRE